MKANKEVKTLASVGLVAMAISFLVYLFVSQQKSVADQARPSLAAGMANFSEGPSLAKVTVTEYFDPECESCAEISPYIKNEIKYYQGRVRWVFRYMAYHPNSRNAIRILEAARKQNLYFEAMTLLFQKQQEWGARHDGTDQNQSKEKELLNIISTLPGINLTQLQVDMKNPDIDQLIENDKKDGAAAGVTGTPTLFVNGAIINPLSLDTMLEKIEAGFK